jgi:DNA-binding MarR family transcriptional regulator
MIRAVSASLADERPPLGFLIVRIAEAVDRAFVGALADLGLKGRDLRLLVLVDRTPGLSQRELAQQLGVDAGNLVAILDALEAAGLVERGRDPRDRRHRRVELTPHGREVLAKALRATAAVERELVADLPPAERDRYYEATLSVYREVSRSHGGPEKARSPSG